MSIDAKDSDTYSVWTKDSIRYQDLDPNEPVNYGAINEYFEDGQGRFRQDYLVSGAFDILSVFPSPGLPSDTIPYWTDTSPDRATRRLRLNWTPIRGEHELQEPLEKRAKND